MSYATTKRLVAVPALALLRSLVSRLTLGRRSHVENFPKRLDINSHDENVRIHVSVLVRKPTNRGALGPEGRRNIDPRGVNRLLRFSKFAHPQG